MTFCYSFVCVGGGGGHVCRCFLCFLLVLSALLWCLALWCSGVNIGHNVTGLYVPVCACLCVFVCGIRMCVCVCVGQVVSWLDARSLPYELIDARPSHKLTGESVVFLKVRNE